MRRSLILGIYLAACGPVASGSGASGDEARDVAANQNAPSPEPYVPPRQQTAGGQGSSPGTAPSGSGTSREDPVAVCGPVESYRYVSEYRCPDGSQPLGEDAAAGQRSRVGNVGANATGHVIDRYRVPCPREPVDVYIDMYACTESQNLFGAP